MRIYAVIFIVSIGAATLTPSESDEPEELQGKHAQGHKIVGEIWDQIKHLDVPGLQSAGDLYKRLFSEKQRLPLEDAAHKVTNQRVDKEGNGVAQDHANKTEAKDSDDCYHSASYTRYQPTWESIDSRELPEWYDEAKVGIFLHWGVYSVPSFGGESAWLWHYWKDGDPNVVDFMKKNYPPKTSYPDFASQFTAEFFDPVQWADLFSASGAKYVVLTTKHHEGYSLWPTFAGWNWNAMDVGPKRDLVGELAAAVRNHTDIKFGIYYSLADWYHPLYLYDAQTKYHTQWFVLTKSKPELCYLVEKYRPSIIWADGVFGRPTEYWHSLEFLAWLYNHSPVKDMVVVNDRWGNGTACRHGGYFNCKDHYNPGVLQSHKWEDATTLDKHSWGYRRNLPQSDVRTIEEVLLLLVRAVSCGGNFLLNVGPTHDGRIIPIFEERLRQLGSWLQINGESIYGSKPWSTQQDPANPLVWYTQQNKTDPVAVYGIVTSWPKNGALFLSSPITTIKTTVSVLGYNVYNVQWKVVKNGMMIQMPPMSDISTQWTWVVKLLYVK